MGKSTLKRQRENAPAETDSAQAPKRARQGGDVQLAKLYTDLAAESEETRFAAAKEIIVSFSSPNEPSGQSVEKALIRLIRGLCSSAKAARFGFCVTLTELLRLFFGKPENKVKDLNLDIKGVVDLVEEKTKVQGKVPGKERRDHLIGRLFGYKAIMQSKILTEPELSLDVYTKVLDHIYELARDVPWLREECGLVLVEAISSLKADSTLRSCARELIQRLVSSNLAYTPEGVAIWLTVKGRCEDVLPKDVWKEQDPLSKKEWARLAKVLREDFRNVSENGEAEKIKSAPANPNPIFAWDLVIAQVLRRDQESGKSEFPHFWRDTVDNNLFAASASHERKSWGFKLFASLIKVAPDNVLGALFSPNLVRSLVNQSKKEDRFLHAASVASLNAVEVRVKRTPASALPIVEAITTKVGPTALSKTVVQAMLATDDKTLRKVARHFHTLILRPDTQEQAIADQRRRAIADMLLTVVNGYKHYDSDEFLTGEEHDTWLRNVLDILIEFAYFVPSQSAKTSKVPLPALSAATRKVFQERLSSCLTKLLSLEIESRSSFPVLAVGLIRSKATSSKSLDLVFKADEAILKTISKAFKNVDGLATQEPRSKAAEGFLLMYCLAIIQVYDGEGDAVMLLDDLAQASKPLLKGMKDPSADGQDAFVEIILSFLGNPRTLFKKVAQEAFEIFCQDLTADGLQSLTDILETSENLEGQKELFNEAGDDVEEGDEEAGSGDDDDIEDVEDMSDVEMVDGELTKSKGDAEDSSMESGDEEGSDDESSASESDDEDEDEDDEGDDEEAENFEKLLALTLGTKKPSMHGEDDDDSSDDSDMDDEQMMALDPHLSKVFKERSKLSNKKKREEAKQTVVQFKNRVLDLLAIFLEKQWSNPLTLDVLLPLLRRTRAGNNEQLAERCSRLVKDYTNRQKHKNADLPKPDNLEGVWQVLEGIHEEAKQGGGSKRHGTACSEASLHIAKVVVALDKANYGKVVDLYAAAQKEWMAEKRSLVQPVMFQQFLNWSISLKHGK